MLLFHFIVVIIIIILFTVFANKQIFIAKITLKHAYTCNRKSDILEKNIVEKFLI